MRFDHLVDDQQVGDGLAVRADHVAALFHSFGQDLLNLLSDDACRRAEQEQRCREEEKKI